MKRAVSPFDLWTLGLDLTYLAVEAQTVVALRLWGMAGVWSVTPHEHTRMVTEKTQAFTESAWGAAKVATGGGRPDQVASAAIRPLRRKTRANSRRLIKRGPRVK